LSTQKVMRSVFLRVKKSRHPIFRGRRSRDIQSPIRAKHCRQQRLLIVWTGNNMKILTVSYNPNAQQPSSCGARDTGRFVCDIANIRIVSTPR
jgi:hypothetical protein